MWREENRATRRKTQQTQPTYHTGPESNPGRVGGKRSRPCAISAPQPMASAVPVAFWLVLPVKEGRILYGLQIFNKISILQNLSLGYIFKIFLKFLKFEP